MPAHCNSRGGSNRPSRTDVVTFFDGEKWPRLFEQLFPIYKWILGGLRLMSRGASKISSYAASFNCGKPAQYFSCGVSRSRLECGRCVLYQPG